MWRVYRTLFYSVDTVPLAEFETEEETRVFIKKAEEALKLLALDTRYKLALAQLSKGDPQC